MIKNSEELLDFCRIKKIFDKGFGFFTSLHYSQDVFFHFSKIKNNEVRDKLRNMKRGLIYVFFTSKESGDKRKVDRIWLEPEKIDKNLLPQFKEKIIMEFDEGKTNLYELAYIVKLFREKNIFSVEDYKRIIFSKKVVNNPAVIKAMLKESELGSNKNFENIIEKMDEKNFSYNKGAEILIS